MKRFAMWSLILGALILAPRLATCEEKAKAEPPVKEKCKLDVPTCLGMYDKMRERPWLGIEYKAQADGTLLIERLVPGGPAEAAGMKPGDTVMSVEGVPLLEAPKLLAGKAGWRIGGKVKYKVQRNSQEKEIPVTLGQISNELLAKLIGEHMVENHLASADPGASNIH